MTRTVRNALAPGDGIGAGMLEAALKVSAGIPVCTGDFGGPAATAEFFCEVLTRGGVHSTV